MDRTKITEALRLTDDKASTLAILSALGVATETTFRIKKLNENFSFHLSDCSSPVGALNHLWLYGIYKTASDKAGGEDMSRDDGIKAVATRLSNLKSGNYGGRTVGTAQESEERKIIYAVLVKNGMKGEAAKEDTKSHAAAVNAYKAHTARVYKAKYGVVPPESFWHGDGEKDFAAIYERFIAAKAREVLAARTVKADEADAL